jgi:hypothetical protein
MSVNKYRPHVYVLPEDDANRQLANGFHMQVPSDRQQQMGLLNVAGGWTKTLELFALEHEMKMDLYPERFMVLLIDFDGNQQRLTDAKATIPHHLSERVFILGVLTEPEALKGDLEQIGADLAKDCREDTHTAWAHPLLQHNAGELDRLRKRVRPILFASP